MFHGDWDKMSKDEQDLMVQSELDELIHAVDFIQAGLAVRRAGLIWFLPLCHDAYGENI